ncbi:MAG: glycosyltransferase family 2 protein [Elusimicrobia bacterium]|nr:glycosyltransferase family 2 protein [Candidatus Liberimonas magnetica]
MEIKMSLIMPACNEEIAIRAVLEQVKHINDIDEVIVIDDGSTDSTAKIARECGAKVFSNTYTVGYGASIKTGIRKAKNNLIAIIDADGTYQPEDISKMLEYIESFDMVVGERPKASIEASRRPAKWALSKLANYLSGITIPDLNSGLRIFSRDIALKYFNLLPQGFSFTTTITLAMLNNNYTVKFVPISYKKRNGKSKIKPFQDTLTFIKLIVRTIMYFNPLKVFLPISLPLIIIGALIATYHVIFFHSVNKSSILMTVSGLQILAIGMIADLINRRLQQ